MNQFRQESKLRAIFGKLKPLAQNNVRGREAKLQLAGFLHRFHPLFSLVIS
jgi:hypothetical protein